MTSLPPSGESDNTARITSLEQTTLPVRDNARQEQGPGEGGDAGEEEDGIFRQSSLKYFQWIEAVMGEPLPAGDFADVLKDGVVLCKLINKIQPGSVKKFKEKGPAFMLMENVQSFIQAAKKYGVPDEEMFLTPDLFEGKNLSQVSKQL